MSLVGIELNWGRKNSAPIFFVRS